jgi:FAD:protein FMN transferase
LTNNLYPKILFIMSIKKKSYILQVLFILILIGIGVWNQSVRLHTAAIDEFLMDTVFQIEISGKHSDLSTILDSVITEAFAYEQKFSYYKIDSMLSRINAASDQKINIEPEFYELLKAGDYFYRESSGSYDLSIGALTDIWDISSEVVPQDDDIAAALNFVGFENIIYDSNILSKPAGCKINLGSIAKGYVIDRIIKRLIHCGVDKILVNAGGDIRTYGMGEILIGIQHPRRTRGEIIDRLRVTDKAVVTSGDYERYFELDGIRYHHIIDANTGYPARNCVSVTAIADDAQTADALSTAAFLMPVSAAVKLADSFFDAALIIYHYDQQDNLTRTLSSNAKNYLE